VINTINWDKVQGLLPAIVQDVHTGAVLMFAYMNREAFEATQSSGRATFFSRTKQRLWTKGETSGHYLSVRSMALDCDADALLVLAEPAGPTCHLGSMTCWGEHAPRAEAQAAAFLGELESIISQRARMRPAGSYTAKLLEGGTPHLAQKVGEEGVEVALAAVCQSEEALLGEAADLLYHLLLLLNSKGISLARVTQLLEARHRAATGAG
jgi:phosphoribosyl-ATP pyrophosphohydrolase/phosphoribosyl-AMP cyclohydrolase